MAIYKKERMWSEKLTSAEFDIPEVQRGVIALKKRNRLCLVIPTTINRIHSVELTALNTQARTILKNGYAASHTKVLATASSGSYAAVSYFRLIDWQATAAARAEDELLYVTATKKLYMTTRAIPSTTSKAANAYSAAVVTAALASGQIVELNQFATGAAVFIPIKIVASSTASAGASIGRFAFEVRGFK